MQYKKYKINQPPAARTSGQIDKCLKLGARTAISILFGDANRILGANVRFVAK